MQSVVPRPAQTIPSTTPVQRTGITRGATSKAGRALSRKRGLDMVMDAEAEGTDHQQGEQEQEDPHAAYPGGRDDPAVRFGHFGGVGAQGDHAHPAHPLVKSRILLVRPCRRWKISRTSAGVATMKTMTAWMTVVRSMGIPVVACI